MSEATQHNLLDVDTPPPNRSSERPSGALHPPDSAPLGVFDSPEPRQGIRWTLVGVALIVAMALVTLMSWAIRLEAVCGPTLDQWLARATARVGLTVSRGAINPTHLTGLEIHDLVLRRPEGTVLASLHTLTVYPSLSDLLQGDVAPGVLHVEGLRVYVQLKGGGKGDLPLLEQLLESRPLAPSVGRQGSARRRLPTPEVRLTGASFVIEDREGRLGALRADRSDVVVAPSPEGVSVAGQLVLDGYGPGNLSGHISSRSGTAQLRVTLEHQTDLTPLIQGSLPGPLEGVAVRARGVALHWPPSVALEDAWVTGLHQPLPWRVGVPSIFSPEPPVVTELEAGRFALALGQAQAHLETEDAVLRMSHGAGSWSVPVGDVSAWFDDAHRQVMLDMTLGGIQRRPSHVWVHWDADAGRAVLDGQFDGLPIAPYARLMPAGVSPHVVFSGGVLFGRLAADIDRAQQRADLSLDLEGELHDVDAPMVARQVLSVLPGGMRGVVRWDGALGRLELRDGAAHLGELAMELGWTVERVDGEHWRVWASLQSPKLDAHRVLTGLPTELIPVLEGYRLKGPFDFALTLEVDTRKPEELGVEGHINVDDVTIVEYGPKAAISALLDDFQMRAVGLPEQREIGPLTSGWVPYNAIPDVVPQAVSCAEDGRFWTHQGFDPKGIYRAMVANVAARRVVRGGSTISQQVIKNLYLNHDRTASRKLQEAFLTWALEGAVPKARIMEIYLNMLHWGPGIYGIRTASRVLFDKRPARLSLREAAFLGSILPNPNYFTTLYADGILPPDRRRKMGYVLRNMHRAGYINTQTLENAEALIRRGIVSIAPYPKLRLAFLLAEQQQQGDL